MKTRKWMGIRLSCLAAALGAGGLVLANRQDPCACGDGSQSIVSMAARAQQAHYASQGEFAADLDALNIEITLDSPRTVTVQRQDTAAFVYARPKIGRQASSYVSGVFVLTEPGETGAQTVPKTTVIVCEAPSPAALLPPVDAQTCAVGTQKR